MYQVLFAFRLDEEQTLEFSSNGFRQKKCKHLSAEGRSEKTGRKTVADVYRILAQFSSREVFDKDFFSSHIHLLFCYFLQVLFAQMHFLRGYIFNLKLRAILMTFAK